jgi:hypothetical protein
MLASSYLRLHAPGMFVVTQRNSAAIRAAFDQAATCGPPLRRLFAGITDSDQVRAFVPTPARRRRQ